MMRGKKPRGMKLDPEWLRGHLKKKMGAYGLGAPGAVEPGRMWSECGRIAGDAAMAELGVPAGSPAREGLQFARRFAETYHREAGGEFKRFEELPEEAKRRMSKYLEDLGNRLREHGHHDAAGSFNEAFVRHLSDAVDAYQKLEGERRAREQ